MTTETGAFDALLGELGDLAKALPTDAGGEGDAAIAAAAAEGGTDVPAGEGAEGTEGESKDKGEPFGKSFTIKLDDGTEVEAVDGAQLIKSLVDRVETNEGAMAKALGLAVGLIKGQGELIKSLTDQVGKLNSQGVGRKAILSIAEKAPAATELAKSIPDANAVTGEEVMAKAMIAQSAGRITGLDVIKLEGSINRGMQPPEDILRRVYADK
jgi:hypothetical protein